MRVRTEVLAEERLRDPAADDRLGDGTGLHAAVVAENEVLRRGIEGLLRSVPEVGVVRDCAGPDALAALLHQRLDVVVVSAGDAGWLEEHRVALTEAGVRVLLLVDDLSVDELSNYPSYPRGGFLWQPSLTSAALRDALRQFQHGEAPMPPELLQALLARADGRPHRRSRNRPVSLTGRELEALTLLVKGLSNKQIARRLSISSHGAKRLVASIMLKLDAPNRTLAAVTAIRSGIVAEDNLDEG